MKYDLLCTPGFENPMTNVQSNNTGDKLDTIAAISTPPGVGAIAIVRMSGPHAISIADRLFRGKIPLIDAATHTIHFGRITTDAHTVLDQVLVTVMRAPRTYTGEDVVEINCHGGMVASRLVLQALLDHGARLGMPGEFTKRAFLHGRLDLVQAEAIGDLIHAHTDMAGILATRQLTGHLSREIQLMREKLLHVSMMLEVAIDFSEDEVDSYEPRELIDTLNELDSHINQLIGNIERGRIVKEGVQVTICGKENVGKSSIFNALLNKNRAIVTDIPGTTRDVVEDVIAIDGIPFRLYDTAGIRLNTEDEIEIEGIRRSHQAIENAGFIIYVVDSSKKLLNNEKKLYNQLKGRPHLVVLNKIDLGTDCSGFRDYEPDSPTISVSTVTGQGIPELTRHLGMFATQGDANFMDHTILGNIRQVNCLKQARESIDLAIQSLRHNASPELVAVDIRTTIRALGEVVGTITTDDIIHSIFKQFCIGK